MEKVGPPGDPELPRDANDPTTAAAAAAKDRTLLAEVLMAAAIGVEEPKPTLPGRLDATPAAPPAGDAATLVPALGPL